MMAQEIETAARQRFNAVSDNFWTPIEVYSLIYFAQIEMARKANVIERIYSTSSVANQQAYPYPTNSIAQKRVTWNGIKMVPFDMQNDDLITGGNQATTSSGDPQFYYIWNYNIYLRPIPSSVQTIQLFSIDLPNAVTAAGTTLDIPLELQPGLVNFVLREMCAKDKIFSSAEWYGNLWEKDLLDAMAWKKRRKRFDAFVSVKDEGSFFSL